MRKIKYMFFAVISLVMALSITAYAENEELPQFDLNTVIVITKPQRNIYSLSSLTADKSAEMEDVLNNLGITQANELMTVSDANRGISLFSANSNEKKIIELTLPEGGEDKVWEAVDALNASGTVEMAEPNYYCYLNSVPDDTYYNSSSSYNYHLKKVGAENVWDMNIDCSGINVAVLDSGILSGHEDLADNISTTIPGYDFAEGDSDPDDTYDADHASDSGFVQGHGTHVSGIVSAVTNNGKGVASLAGGTQGKGAKIVPVKLFKDAVDSSTGKKYKTTSTANIVNSINYVKNNNIPIASCSWGGKYIASVDTAIKSCTNTLFVFAAGNYGKSNDSGSDIIYPASLGYDNIISVGASTESDTLASFSNYGNNVDLAAPGYGIYSTHNTNLSVNSYKSMNGTSQATPLVASCAAVMKAVNPDLTPAEIKRAILNNADAVSTLSYNSGGTTRRVKGNRRLNAYNAVMSIAQMHQVTWKNYDGTILKTTNVLDGKMPEYTGETPVKPSTDEYEYTFSGWSPALDRVTEDTEYTAVFEEKKRQYTVTWANYDGTVLMSQKVDYDTAPQYTGNTPQKASDTLYNYIFDGWDKEITAVKEDTAYTAKYTKEQKSDVTILNSYTEDIDVGKIIKGSGDAEIHIEVRDGEDKTFFVYLAEKTDSGAVCQVEKYEFDNGCCVIPEKTEADNYSLYIWTSDMIPIIEPVNNMSTFWTKTSQ